MSPGFNLFASSSDEPSSNNFDISAVKRRARGRSRTRIPVAIPGVNRGARENSESDEASDFEHMTHEEICDRAKDERDAMQLEQDEAFDRAYAAIP